MRYFGRDERAERYHSSRPRVHQEVIRRLVGERLMGHVDHALDVGCGTGHSTDALRAVSRHGCIGLDIEPAMLQRAVRSYSSLAFVLGDAERLPFPDRAFQLVSASMAFHWLESGRFLGEASRVLTPGGRLLVYNLWFPGETEQAADFNDWFLGPYLTRFPSPPRHTVALKEVLATARHLRFVGSSDFEFQVPFTAASLGSYLTTQSNVEAAVRRGTPLDDIDVWLAGELEVFFPSGETLGFTYRGLAELAIAS